MKKMEITAKRANNVVEEGDIARGVKEHYLVDVLAVNMGSIAIAVSVS